MACKFAGPKSDESLWSVFKMDVKEGKPSTTGEVIQVIMAVWDKLAISAVNWLVALMSRRIQKRRDEKGNHLDYEKPKRDPIVISRKDTSTSLTF
jgi:hypothetical protein